MTGMYRDALVLAISLATSTALFVLWFYAIEPALSYWFDWFGDTGPMYLGGRRHRRYARRMRPQWDAQAALTTDDREWLIDMGWKP